MAPKKGKGKGGGAVIDGVDTSAMTREQLEAFALRLKNELEREREERNFFQLERDKLRTFWEITRNQLEESRAIIRTKERDVELTQEQTEVDVKQIVQQMKHLQYETQTKIGELRAENMTQLMYAQEDHDLQELELLKDKREIKRLLREKEEQTELQIQQLKMKHSELLSLERARFESEAKEMLNLHEKRLQHYMDESEVRHRMEMSEVEERKNTQISRLIETHGKILNEAKNYYNDITLNNLALISSLKEQMEELRRSSEKNKRLVYEVQMENNKLVEPLRVANTEVTELRRKLENYDRDKRALLRNSNRFEAIKKELNNMKWETEALKMRCDKLTEERDQLKIKFEEAILELQQKTGLKNVMLERKLCDLQKDIEKREAIMGEYFSASGMESQNLSIRFEKLLQSKNDKIQNLRYEFARACKAHDDLLNTFMAKMDQFGIPKDELGFQPFKTFTQLQLGVGPANLVAKNK